MRHPQTLIELMQLYPTEDDCRQAMFAHRWPPGFACRRCGHERAWYLRGRGLFEGASRRYQNSAHVVPGNPAVGLHHEGAFGRPSFPVSSA